MKKYNKSEIMKSAWNKFRTGNYINFAAALRKAWREAKTSLANQRKLGWVLPTDLNTGDTLQVMNQLSYVRYEKEIASIEKADLGFYGTVVTFADGELRCFPNHSPVQRVAVAAEVAVA